MATSLVVNAVSYLYPDTGDQSWGTAASAWAAAVTNGMLQKAGGTFALTANVNFGPTFGLISKYFTSVSTNPAASGVLRLSDTDSIAFRNHANSGDILLGKNTSDALTFGGSLVGTVTAITVASSNGFTGSSSGGGTPALTLATSVTGVVKGNGTAISAAAYADIAALFKHPTIQKFTSGSGSTYTLPTSPAPFYIRVKIMGGGGGGAGGGSTGATAGGAGGTSTFGTSLLTANGGAGGTTASGSSINLGGTVTVGAGATPVIAVQGGNSVGGNSFQVSGYATGLSGAASFLGGSGGSAANAAGGAGSPNTGGGGGGGGSTATGQGSGGGGASGGYIDALIFSPASTYLFTIGVGGLSAGSSGNGSAGTNGFVGGTGADGQIVVEEYYQ